ncbi:cysteine dioxygenase family protein [Pseudoroseomonas ludipueritiae]|nr:cysteine dioxygenase family protein [Pseudoroseomonas ludipueritiae]
MLADIHHAVAGDAPGCPRRVAAAIHAYLHDPELLDGIACPSCPNGYIRHLLHADSSGRYAVVALVWRPGQMSPVHAHRTWCALGVHRGVLSEAFYDLPEGNSSPCQTATLLRGQGAVSFGPADLRTIHRLANLGTAEAVSIHVYGASFDRFGQDVNHLF